VTGSHPAHKKPAPLIPKGSLVEQVEEDYQGGTGCQNEGAGGRTAAEPVQ